MARAVAENLVKLSGSGAPVMDQQEIFRKMCLTRYFEHQVAEAYTRKLVPGVIYLSVGQEAPSAVISQLTPGYSVFVQHRCHSVYLAHGGKPEVLRDELLGKTTGCCRGKGGSPSPQDLEIPMFSYHGLIGENIPLGTGYALASKRPGVIYFGDAAAEEDYALTSFGFAATHKLPVLYVCEDNNLSICTSVEERRSWDVCAVAESVGLNTACVDDDPELIHGAVSELLKKLPAFVNIRTCRHLWHAGVGRDGPPEWDRLDEYRQQVPQAEQIEQHVMTYVEQLWQEQLQRQ